MAESAPDRLQSRAGLRKIQEESARYNIGHIQRTMNLPTFALAYLHPSLRRRFEFTEARRNYRRFNVTTTEELKVPK